MGRTLVRAIAAAPDLSLAGATERPGSGELGRDAGAVAGLEPAGVAITDDPAQAAAGADVWIDFTTPAAVLAALAAVPCPLVIGATGFDPAQDAQIAHAAQSRAIVKSGNFSLGVALLAALVRQAAARLGPEWDIEITEAHHRRKIDAPSGTALLLGEAAAQGRGVSLAGARMPADRNGSRPEGGIGFSVIRGGGIIGDHSVALVAEEEAITLSHRAFDRGLFAKGALAAARWAQGKPAGLYGVADVLGV